MKWKIITASVCCFLFGCIAGWNVREILSLGDTILAKEEMYNQLDYLASEYLGKRTDSFENSLFCIMADQNKLMEDLDMRFRSKVFSGVIGRERILRANYVFDVLGEKREYLSNFDDKCL